MSASLETDVLIVGNGPAGSSASLFLSTYGIKNIVLTKYRWTANAPRAHITNQRTVEILRDMGLEHEVKEKAVPQAQMGETIFCASLAGEELARLHTWGTHPQRKANFDLASPSSICDIPQDLMEPILMGAAAARGARVRFDTEYLALEQDADGVTATVRDRLNGETYQIRAKYMIGADGGRSKVAEDIGLPMVGRMDIAGSMNIIFEADLSRYVAHRPSVLYWVLQPGSNIGGIGRAWCGWCGFLIVNMLVVGLLLSAPLWASSGQLRSMIELMTLLALAQIWNLLAGYARLVSIGQQAWIGVGAYTMIVVADDFKLPIVVAIIAGGLVAALLALPAAALLFRLRGGYLSIGTWVIAEVLRLLVYLLCAFATGVIGGVIYLNLLRVTPDAAFSVQWTAFMIFIVVIGGIGTIEGPIIGALIFFLLREQLANFGEWSLILLGVVAVSMMQTKRL